ncbi:MAG TPA: peptidoglycan DD-metalloendopeptidase family protein [Fulvivirga sp.]|nr:peptidoglycan DD-metalloendopeptidase family protein [Fulvivirga sp.]
MNSIKEELSQKKHDFAHVTPFDLSKEPYYIFDLTESNQELMAIDLNDEILFTDYIFKTMKKENAVVGIGKYNENRTIYKRSEVFGGEESRSLHLGIDIWAKAGTPVYAPLAGHIHSFANNNQHGDYGPTIILEHELGGIIFYSLYGHLSKISLNGITKGQKVTQGEQIALLGDYSENVHWPPHLHFQIISDIGDYIGDFPGVAKPSEAAHWLERCPDPNLILRMEI